MASNDSPKEAYEQQLFCKWLDEHNITYFAIPNQTYRRPSKNAPYIGVKPGVPDMFICQPTYSGVIKDIAGNAIAYSGTYDLCGLFIEMKRKKCSYPSIDQKIWIKKLNDKGYRAEVAKGHEEAIAIVKDYMGWDDES